MRRILNWAFRCCDSSMDKDGSMKIDWNEWREYHLLNPSGHSVHDIIQFWRHSSVRILAICFYCQNCAFYNCVVQFLPK